MTTYCHEIVISPVEIASQANITTLDFIIDSSYMTRAGREFVDGIDYSDTATHHMSVGGHVGLNWPSQRPPIDSNF